ncbi:MAG: DNA glycosylase [Candidatus Scalinduaceae bacterium]
MKKEQKVRTPNVRDIIEFRKRLHLWFGKNKRKYPWRETSDRYKVLIAELMLRRTKADQVAKVYSKFIEKYPDIKTLNYASIDDINEITYSLGLHWRRNSFIEVARESTKSYGGKIPDKREELKKLTGVGEYVAGTILSLASNKKEWIVDSNVVRVFKRYFGIETTKEGRRDKHVIALAKAYIECKNPKYANLALIDFAALICTPRKPLHELCPLKKSCHYYAGLGI